jgi:hypothetical protein
MQAAEARLKEEFGWQPQALALDQCSSNLRYGGGGVTPGLWWQYLLALSRQPGSLVTIVTF